MDLYSLLASYPQKECHGFNMLQLRVHQAYLITTLLDNTTYNFIFERHRQCVKVGILFLNWNFHSNTFAMIYSVRSIVKWV